MPKKRLIFLLIITSALVMAATVPAAEVHLAWDPSPGQVTGYRIYSSSSSGSYSNDYIEVGNVTNYIVTNLQLDSAYYFVVRAYNSVGESGNSNEVSWPKVSVAATPNPADNPGLNVVFHVDINPAPEKTVTYKWDFKDGSPPEETTSSSINHKFIQAKDYPVELTVIFVNGTSIIKTIDFKVNDKVPSAPPKPTVK